MEKHVCDICAASNISTPATWVSKILINGWIGQAGAHEAYVCDACRDHLPEESEDASELAKSDLEKI